MEIAQAFQQAVKDGNGPKRSLLFLHVTGGKLGFTVQSITQKTQSFLWRNTVCNLNTDMVGRIDPDKVDSPIIYTLLGVTN